MATAAATPEPAPLTAEAFAHRPESGFPEELVEGSVVASPLPPPFHGLVCANFGWLLGDFVSRYAPGYVLSNRTGVITRRDPDTVRGADVAFYSFARVPKGSLPRTTYLDVPPDLVAEVLSPDDRWPDVLAKVAEYLNVGVAVVLVLDTGRRDVQVYTADGAVRTLDSASELTLPAPLAGFRVAVARLFE
jgi:Uma2 family endonuclease